MAMSYMLKCIDPVMRGLSRSGAYRNDALRDCVGTDLSRESVPMPQHC